MTPETGRTHVPELAAGLVPALPSDLQSVRLLGRGSTADVFLAREPGLQRLVAVKVLRRDVAADEIGRRRFMREAQAAARVSHRHVTSIYRIGQLEGDLPYIVMEYVDGRLLSDVLEATGPLPLEEARTLFVSIASALAAVHDCGIIHRDVQPGNIYVENRTGRAVLGDFGIAGLLESGTTTTELTVAGVRLGDMRYTSPEQLQGEKATERSDIYSFGVMAYEVLTGRGPYPATDGQQQLIAHLKSPPTPLTELRPDVDPALASLIEHCLVKDPNRRPRARDLAARLVKPDPTVQVPVGEQSRLGQFMREMRRRRIYQVAAAYGALAVAIIGITEGTWEAFELSQRTFRLIAGVTLAGFPVAMALAWIFDITETGIRRTADSPAEARIGMIKWAALGVSVLGAAGALWLLLRS